jgi:hypothetical protein
MNYQVFFTYEALSEYASQFISDNTLLKLAFLVIQNMEKI